MGLPRSCVCGAIHQYSEPCPLSIARQETRRPSKRERFGPGWDRISRKVIERDSGICWICGEPGADTADHLQPRSLGGPSSPWNLRAAHRRCNSRRGNCGLKAA